MRKVHAIFIVLLVILGVFGVVYLFLFLQPQKIYLYSVYTTNPPKVDGNINCTEWASAFNMSFTFHCLDETRIGELYLMNNDTHLFFAFRIFNEDIYSSPDELWLWLDPDNDEKLDAYEDIKMLKTTSPFYIDAYHTSPYGGMYIYSDSVYGGTQDGYALWNHTNPNGTGILTFETVFPFISSDPHDLNVTRGDTIGINFEYYIFGACWPGDRLKPQDWAKLVIG
jgi:hypothetical protein